MPITNYVSQGFNLSEMIMLSAALTIVAEKLVILQSVAAIETQYLII